MIDAWIEVKSNAAGVQSDNDDVKPSRSSREN